MASNKFPRRGAFIHIASFLVVEGLVSQGQVRSGLVRIQIMLTPKCYSLGQKKTSPVGRVSKDPQIPHSLALDYNLLTASTRNYVGLVKLQGPIKPSAVPQ